MLRTQKTCNLRRWPLARNFITIPQADAVAGSEPAPSPSRENDSENRYLPEGTRRIRADNEWLPSPHIGSARETIARVLPVGEAGRVVTRSPIVARREMGVLLRTLRGERRVTVKQVAVHLKCSLDRIHQMEADSGAEEEDIRSLCDLYDVDPARRNILMSLAYVGNRQGWWERYDVPYKTYIDYEEGAASIKSLSCAAVPGLLQTRDYARATHLSAIPRLGVEDVERGVEVRLNRQRILSRVDPPRFWSILDEAALHREVGGRDMMRNQLNYLIGMCELPNITVQVIPFAAGMYAGIECGFVILEFANPILDVAYTESLFGANEFNAAELYKLVFDESSSSALSEEDSIAFIKRLMRQA